MFEKILNIFKTKNQKFKERTKREKNKFYLFNRKSNFNRTKRSQTQIKFSYNIIKKYFSYLIFISILFWLWLIIFLFFWSYFNIKYIEINDNKNISSIDLMYNSISKIRWANILKVNEISVKDKILSYQKNIKDIKLKKIFPNKIKIDVESYPLVINTNVNNKNYYITSNWVFIPNNNNIKYKKDIPKIYIISKELNWFNIFDYKKILETEQINNIIKLINLFKFNIIDIHIKNIYFYKIEKEIHILTKNDTLLIFDINEDILSQVKKLIIFNEENPNFKHIYIDLRINHKIFYCEYKNEYQCRSNLRISYPKINF